MLVKMQNFYMGRDNLDTFLLAEKISTWVKERCEEIDGSLTGGHAKGNMMKFLRTRHIVTNTMDAIANVEYLLGKILETVMERNDVHDMDESSESNKKLDEINFRINRIIGENESILDTVKSVDNKLNSTSIKGIHINEEMDYKTILALLRHRKYAKRDELSIFYRALEYMHKLDLFTEVTTRDIMNGIGILENDDTGYKGVISQMGHLTKDELVKSKKSTLKGNPQVYWLDKKLDLSIIT